MVEKSYKGHEETFRVMGMFISRVVMVSQVYTYAKLKRTLTVHVLTVRLFFPNKAVSDHWEGRIFCPQVSPGLRSFHPGSFTP